MTIILHTCNSNKSCVIVMKSLSIKNATGIVYLHFVFCVLLRCEIGPRV